MKKLTFILIIFSINLNAQEVKTFSGIPYYGGGFYSTKKNNHKDSVYFSNPFGIAVDSSGKIYISNENNIFVIEGNRVYNIAGYPFDPNNIQIGCNSVNGKGDSSRFCRPAGLSVLPNQNILIADQDNHQLRLMDKFTNANSKVEVSTICGVKKLNGGFKDSINNFAEFYSPNSVAQDNQGNIYISDRNNHCIRKISNGEVTTFAGTPKSAGNQVGNTNSSKFNLPYSIFIQNNIMYVADYGNNSIKTINLSTNQVSNLITTFIFRPVSVIAVGNVVYFAEALCVKKFENGNNIILAGNPPQSGYANGIGQNALFDRIGNICYNPQNNTLLVSDMGNNVIRSISLNSNLKANFEISNNSVTVGQTVKIYNTSNEKVNIFRWTISPNTFKLENQSKMTDSVIYVSFGQATQYSVKLFVANSLKRDSITKSNILLVNQIADKPIADFTVSNTFPKIDEVINLIDLSSNTPNQWRWRILPSTYIWVNGTDSTFKSPSFKATNAQNFTITLVASNIFGSSFITKKDIVRINGTSIDEVNTENLFYPNPIHDGILNFNFNNNEIWYLVNPITGNKDIIETNIFNVSHYSSGVYLIMNESQSVVKKVIIFN